MATEAEVLDILQRLVDRLEQLDPAYRTMLPSRRTIEAECPDLNLVYHATWARGEVTALSPGPAPERPDIHVALDSDDLVAIVDGQLDFGRAYSQDRVRIRAGMTDLIRLRAVM